MRLATTVSRTQNNSTILRAGPSRETVMRATEQQVTIVNSSHQLGAIQ